jgi:plasmid stabilization system protein ParE
VPELEIHPEALRELSAATGRYADLAGRLVADRFVDEIESAFAAVVSTPGIWNVSASAC